MNKKTVQLTGLAAFILIAAGALYYGLSNNDSATVAKNSEPQKVHILKYSDYSCPACKSFVPAQKQLKQEFGDLIEIEYRYFPLESFQYSRLAARSVEAAKRQGKFKEMHDIIFENQETWSRGAAREYFENYANQIGLDMEQFRADVESEEVRSEVERQRQEGIRRQVNATPTFFLNGQKLRQNPQNYEQFKAMVELYMYRS